MFHYNIVEKLFNEYPNYCTWKETDKSHALGSWKFSNNKLKKKTKYESILKKKLSECLEISYHWGDISKIDDNLFNHYIQPEFL